LSRQSFYIAGGFGIIINISACFLDRNLESVADVIVKMSLWQRTKHNFTMLKEGFKIRILAMTFIFYVLQGSIVPNYEDYLYYYLTKDEGAGFSKFTYSMLRMASFFGVFLGALCYSLCFQNIGIRTHLVIASLLDVVANVG